MQRQPLQPSSLSPQTPPSFSRRAAITQHAYFSYSDHLELVDLEDGLFESFSLCCGRQLSVVTAAAAALRLPLSPVQLRGSHLRRSPGLKGYALCRLRKACGLRLHLVSAASLHSLSSICK